MAGLCCLGSAAFAQGTTGHQHDRGTLSISKEGDRVAIELRIPAQNVVGFEYEPFTVQERATTSAANEWLQTGQGLFALPDEAGCKVIAAVLEVPDWAKRRQQQREREDVAREVFENSEPEAADTSPADYKARYQIDCEHPDKAEWVDVTLLDRLKGPVKLDATVASGERQSHHHQVSKSSTRVPLQ
jgi:hypothetical protein